MPRKFSLRKIGRTWKQIRWIFLITTFLLITYWFIIFYLISNHSNTFDKSQLISLQNSSIDKQIYFWNVTLCPRDQIKTSRKIVVVVHSARQNFLHRLLIRSTWGSFKSRQDWTLHALAFFIGGPGQENLTQEIVTSRNLDLEQNEFGDLVRTDSFVDSYRNMTFKALMVYEWLEQFCSDATVVVKTDDDVFVNWVPLVDQFLNGPKGKRIENKSHFYCYTRRSHWVEREQQHPYYVSEDEFYRNRYPTFCAGWAYLTTIQTVRKVNSVLGYFSKKLWIDDIFVTGLLTEKFNQLIDERSEGRGNEMKNLKIEFKHHAHDWFFWPRPGYDIEADLRQWKVSVRNRIFYLLPHGEELKQSFDFLWNKCSF